MGPIPIMRPTKHQKRENLFLLQAFESRLKPNQSLEQVLRESDQGVLIYVAPTKALVSQIAAEVYARFNKDFKTSGSTSTMSDNAYHLSGYRDVIIQILQCNYSHFVQTRLSKLAA